jgi:hypothetical protein
VDIDEFVATVHAIERRHGLFDHAISDTSWWDTVRFEACTFLFATLSHGGGLVAEAQLARRSMLGALRRAVERRMLFARARTQRGRIMALRAPRVATNQGRRDAVLDPLIALFPGDTLPIDTLPRRYHVPVAVTAKRSLPVLSNAILAVIDLLTAEFALDPVQATHLERLMQQTWQVFESDVAAYHRLFTAANPAAVLLVQNGIEKALLHVAAKQGIPTIEAQHGLIGFGHLGYSYARGIDYGPSVAMPDLFLTFSAFWSQSSFYPARRHAIVGTDHFGMGIPSFDAALGEVMVVSADVYHDSLVAITRALATRMRRRRFIYKLHPNQQLAEAAIKSELSDLPNVVVGDPSTPAAWMMGDVSHIVAIQSTMVYEALQRGRRICIVPGGDYRIHSDIFDQPLVSVCVDQPALMAALDQSATNAPAPVFFERFDADAARRAINECVQAAARRAIP